MSVVWWNLTSAATTPDTGLLACIYSLYMQVSCMQCLLAVHDDHRSYNILTKKWWYVRERRNVARTRSVVNLCSRTSTSHSHAEVGFFLDLERDGSGGLGVYKRLITIDAEDILKTGELDSIYLHVSRCMQSAERKESHMLAYCQNTRWPC